MSSELQWLSSWNLWGVPFASPNTLSRAYAARAEFDSIVRANPAPSCAASADGEAPPVGDRLLAVACFQELWSFRCGALSPLVHAYARLEHTARLGRAPPADRRIHAANNTLLSLLIQLLMIAFGWTLPWLRYDQKQLFVEGAAAAAPRQRPPDDLLTYAIGLDGFSTAPLGELRLLDSGLLMLASKPPTRCGFDAYPRFTLSGEEHMPNKGVLWAHWSGGGGGGDKDEAPPRSTLVMNTHTTAHRSGASTRVDGARQLDFLLAVLARIRRKIAAAELEKTTSAAPGAEKSRLEVFIVGDLNYRYGDADLRLLEQHGFRHLSGQLSTFRDGTTIDHVFTDAADVRCAQPPRAVHTCLSDHALLILPSLQRGR